MVDGSRLLRCVCYQLPTTIYLPFLVALATPLSAQVDPTGRWRTFETAHFNVHVREEYAALGPRAAGEAEAAWSALAALLPAPRRKVELIVADNIDDPNGYATTYPLAHIVVYAIAPAGDIELESYDRWLRLVITHELTHIFHLDEARGWWGVGRKVLGRAPFLFPNDYTPPWMREGLAVFYESQLTGAGRLGEAYHRAVVGAAGGEEGGLLLDAANTPTGKFPAGVRDYAFGATVWGGVGARRGDSAVARFVRGLAGRPIPYLQLGSAWHRATGEGVGASWDSAQGRYQSLDDAALSERVSGARMLLNHLRLTIAPRVSRDGRFVALAYNDGSDATRLMILDRRARSGDSVRAWRRVARLNAVNGVAWMPDGRVLVSQLEYTDPNTIRSDLWAIAMDGTARQVTQRERLREPDVADDGAIVAVRTLPGGSELVLIDPPSAGRGAQAIYRGDARLHVIAPEKPGVEYATPRFGAGDTIAVVRVHGGWHDIRLIDRSGRLLRDLTSDSVPDLMPAFSPDGSWLTWSREVQGTPQIVGLSPRAGGRRLVTLTGEPWAAYAPAPLGPDSLYFIAYHADGYRLEVAAMDSVGAPLSVADTVHPIALSPSAGSIRERGYNPFPSLLPQYWIPQMYAEAGGTWVGALSAGSDVLGRHTWAASAMAGLGALRGRVYGELAYQYAGIRHVSLDASWSHHPSLLLVSQNTPSGPGNPTVSCCNTSDAWNAGVTVLRRRWRTQALVRFGLELTDDIQAERWGGSVSGTVTHAIVPALAISPQDGWQLGVRVRQRTRTTGDLHSTETVVTGSAYLSGASRGFARQVFALHGAFGTVGGNDPVVFSTGGVSSGALDFLPGVSLGGGVRNFQVRGYAPGALTGRHVMALSLENRVPLALIDRGLGMLPLGLDKVSASLFADGALAWSAAHCPAFLINSGSDEACAEGIWSVGAELVSDVAVGYEYRIRIRTGGALRVSQGGKAGFWIALGTAF